MSAGGDPSKRGALGRQASLSSLEQGLNMVNLPPTIAPVTIYPGPGAHHANMAKADLDLVTRLQQLRGSDSSAVPTEAETEQRLARLKGLPADYYATQPPAHIAKDTRTQHQQSSDLLAQVMDESRLESCLPNPDSELHDRLFELRGGAGRGVGGGAVGLRQQAPLLDSPGLPPELEDISEVAKLLKEAGVAADTDAAKALVSLRSDPVLATSVKEKHRRPPARRRQQQRHQRTSSSEKERLSDSSDDVTRRKVMVKKMGRSGDKDEAGKLTAEDEEEVSRIVNMYTKRAADKKNKKKLLKKKNTGLTKKGSDTKLLSKCEARVSETDSSSEMSESDLKSSASEKLSDSSS